MCKAHRLFNHSTLGWRKIKKKKKKKVGVEKTSRAPPEIETTEHSRTLFLARISDSIFFAGCPRIITWEPPSIELFYNGVAGARASNGQKSRRVRASVL